MPKLKLEIEALEVESFGTAGTEDARGTVHGRATENTLEPCDTNPFNHCTGGSYDTQDWALCTSNAQQECPNHLLPGQLPPAPILP